MRWDVMVPAWLATIEADTVVQRILGTDPSFYMAGERQFECPSMEYTLLTRGIPEREVFWRTLVQLDYWVRTMEDLADLERALIGLLHSDLPVTIGGEAMETMLVGNGGPLEGAEENTFTGSLDFRLVYLKGRYRS